jgi:hypothetical protein
MKISSTPFESIGWTLSRLYAYGVHVTQADLLPALDYIREHGSPADIHEIETLTLHHLKRINTCQK